MQVKRLSWLGTRTERFDETTAFFRDVLGIPVLHEETGFAMLQLPGSDRDFVEVFGFELPPPPPRAEPRFPELPILG